MLDARYIKPDATNPLTNAYNETIRYDKNGNITNLNRNGGQDLAYNSPIEIDDLTYKYDVNNNQLRGVYDNSNSSDGFKDKAGSTLNDIDYTYDANGNMITDANKGITSIKYNHLNLPTQIVFNNNTSTKINYIYNAVGQKLQKIVSYSAQNQLDTTDYLDGFQYKNQVLEFFGHAEGYVTNTLTTKTDGAKKENYNYMFNHLDHLGNVRVSYTWDEDLQVLKIIEENGYYPFGLKHSGYNSDLKERKAILNDTKVELKAIPGGGAIAVESLAYQYKYQGQERQDELGLNWDSFKWRNYDYAIGRFMSIDPLTEKYHTWTPYAFSGNRVVDSRELEGLEPVEINKGTTNLIIAIQGWQGGNPDSGKTQSRRIGKDTFASSLVNTYGSQAGTQVAVFDASMNSRTPTDISKSIQDFRKESPDGKLVIAGHSLGADNAVNVVNDNPDVKVDKLITLDISDPMGAADNQISSNVTEAKNYYQTNNPFVGGTQVEAAKGNTTSTVTNVQTTGDTKHTNIDNNYRQNVVNDVKETISTQ